MKNHTWKRIWSVLLILTMFIGTLPNSSLADDPPEIIPEDIDIPPGSDILTEEPAHGNETHYPDFLSAVHGAGHAYALADDVFPLYSNPEMIDLLCYVHGTDVPFYSDFSDGTTVRLWFCDQDHTVVSGYAAFSAIKEEYLDDAAAASSPAEAFSGQAGDETVLLFETLAEYPLTDAIISADPIPETDSDPEDEMSSGDNPEEETDPINPVIPGQESPGTIDFSDPATNPLLEDSENLYSDIKPDPVVMDTDANSSDPNATDHSNSDSTGDIIVPNTSDPVISPDSDTVEDTEAASDPALGSSETGKSSSEEGNGSGTEQAGSESNPADSHDSNTKDASDQPSGTAPDDADGGDPSAENAEKQPSDGENFSVSEDDPFLIEPDTGDDATLAVGDFILVPAGVMLFSLPDASAAESGYDSGVCQIGWFAKDTIAQIKCILSDSSGETWYEAGYLFGEYGDFSGILMWDEEGTVFVPARNAVRTDSTERELSDITPAPVKTRMLLRSSGSVNLSSLVESGYNKTSGDVLSSLVIMSSYGSDDMLWKRDGTQIYALSHYKAASDYSSSDKDTSYQMFCIQPALLAPGNTTNYWEYFSKGLNTYSSKVYNAIRYCIRNGFPFKTYNGDSTNTRRMTVSAIRQVLLDWDSSYTGDKYDMNSGTLTGNSQAGSIYNESSFYSTGTQWLNYARWLASAAEDEADLLDDYAGSISLSSKQGLNPSGSGYTGSVVVTTGCDSFKIPRSDSYSLSGYRSQDSSWYYFDRGATVGVTTSSTSVSFEIASFSTSSEVGLQQYQADSKVDERQDLIFPYRKGADILKRTTVSFTYTPPVGNVKVVKKDDSGNILSGVSFTLSNGSGYSSTKSTNGSGIAEWTDLTPGTYTLTESVPVGFLPVSSQNVSVTAGNTSTVNVVNNRIRATVAVTKYRKVMYDGMTPRTLQGAALELRTAGTSTVVGTRTSTNASGQAIWTGIPYGTYDIYEVTPPEGYQEIGKVGTVTVTEPQVTYRQDIINTPIYGSVAAVKYRKGTTTPLSGATFELLDSTKQSRAVDINGQTTSLKTTGADGVVRWDNIEYGTYYIRETQAPVGYQLDSTPKKVIVETQSDIARFDAMDDWISGYIKVIKRSTEVNEPIAGVEFDVLDSAGHVAAHLVTNTSGEAVSDALEYGDYTVKETACSELYIMNTGTFPVSIREHGKTYEVSVTDEENYGWIELNKLDELDRHPIAGVQFEIVLGETVKETVTTDANGYAKSGRLVCGTYTVREKANPTGYVNVLSAESGQVKKLETATLSFKNMPIQGKIRIIKSDELTKEKLTGAEFTVTRISGLPSHNGEGNGEVVAVITTDDDGIAETELLTYGKYQVEETVVPEHFKDKHYKTEVDIVTDSKDEVIIYPVEVENEPTPGWVQLLKTDRVTGNPIPGIQFDVYRYVPNGPAAIWEITENREFVETITTNADGIALSSPILKGCYYIVEKQPTPGYYFENVEFDGIVVKSDETTELTATNAPVQITLSVYKRDDDLYKGPVPANTADQLPSAVDIDTPDAHGDALLTGAEFKVTADEDVFDRQGNRLFSAGDTVTTMITAGNGAMITSDPLFPGKYSISETNPPTGYKPTDTVIHIDATLPATQSDLAVVDYQALILNEVKRGRYGIIKFFGDNAIHTDAGILENAEPNATFAVWLTSAGSYDDARPDERDILVTNAFGKAKTTDLPYGVYTIQQLSGKPGYAIKAPYNFRITGDEDPYDTPMDIINNEAYHYWLKIIKTDEKTGKSITLAHTKFKIRDEEGQIISQTLHYPADQEIDTFETDDTGSVQLPESLLWGKYYISEFESPEGYLITTDELEVDVGALADETFHVEVEFPDAPVMGNIYIDKTGLQLTGFETVQENGYDVEKPIYENRFLAGAVFEIRAAEDIIGKDETVWFEKDELADTIVTTNHGHDGSVDLPLGKYYVLEKSAPTGYVFSTEPYMLTLDYADNQTAKVSATVTAGNDYLKSDIRLEKEIEVTSVENLENGTVHQVITRVPGEGFVFGLFNKSTISAPGKTVPADSLLAAAVTGANGRLSIIGYYPHGEYYLKELSGKEGWKPNTKKYSISLLPDLKSPNDNVIRVGLSGKVLNELVYFPVTITKTDLTEEETIPGALIEIYDETGAVIYREYTDKDGNIPDIPVIPGKYTFKEILAPEGYALNTAVLTFEVDENGRVTGDTVIHDDYTRVRFTKHDTDGEIMEGVEFTLFDEEGSPVKTALSDSEGLVTFEKIPYGKFTVEETKTLEGYIRKAGTLIRIEVDGTFENADKPSGDIRNTPNEIRVKKVDQNGKVLPGAKFGLFDESGKEIMSTESDKDGIVVFRKIPSGKLTIRETQPLEGYLQCKTVYSFVVDDNFRNSAEPVATFVNRLKRIKYIKVDTSGQFLEGVEFSLINKATGETVETVKSDKQGVFTFTRFDYGDWIIRETKVPDGYNQMNDMELHVGDDWTEPAPLTCVNIPNHYEFLKTDNRGNPMPGVTFTLEDANGNIIRNLVSGGDGIVHVTDLKPGKYIIRELETLEGFTRTDDAIAVEISEKYVIPKEMFTLINYPVIQTGVDFDNPGLYLGIGLVAFALLNAVIWLIQRRKKASINKK